MKTLIRLRCIKLSHFTTLIQKKTQKNYKVIMKCINNEKVT